MIQLKRFRPRKASPTPSRHGKRQAQSPAAAVQRPDLTALYAAEHPYQPSTIASLRNYAERCRLEADDLDTQARDFIGLAARRRNEAEEFDRIAALAERDRPLPAGPQSAEPESAWTAPVSGQVVHYQDHVGFWPPCGARETAVFATDSPNRVTCEGCLTAMAAWTPTSEADAAGWNEPLTAPPVADTAVLEAVDGGI